MGFCLLDFLVSREPYNLKLPRKTHLLTSKRERFIYLLQYSSYEILFCTARMLMRGANRRTLTSLLEKGRVHPNQ
jgi:hypothetical protein